MTNCELIDPSTSNARGGRLLDALEIGPGALPLLAVSGSRGKSTVAWMLDAILGAAGRSVAAWLSSGVYAHGMRQDGELGPWARVLRDAQSGDLDLALQELNAPTVVAAGLPRETYPLAILTTLCGNNDSCLLSPETRLERKALAKVLAATREDGLVVASADDYDVAELVDARAGRCALFALRRENPSLLRRLEQGDVGSWVEDGVIMHGSLAAAQPIVAVHEIPATLEGAVMFQTQNALAAVTTAMALGMPIDAIRSGLASYAPDPARQPAACNIVRYNGATIVIDAPAQIWSLRMLARGIRRHPRRRTMVVSGCFPSMRADDLAEAGRILGNLGAIVLLHGDSDSGERLLAIKAGMATAHYPPVVLAMPDELSAIDHLLNSLAEDDMALVLADDQASAIGRLWPAPVISINGHRKAADKVKH